MMNHKPCRHSWSIYWFFILSLHPDILFIINIVWVEFVKPNATTNSLFIYLPSHVEISPILPIVVHFVAVVHGSLHILLDEVHYFRSNQINKIDESLYDQMSLILECLWFGVNIYTPSLYLVEALISFVHVLETFYFVSQLQFFLL